MESIAWATIGGALIGLAATWLLLANGRVAGISGILGSLLGAWGEDSTWRASFLLGLLSGGVALVALSPEVIAAPMGRSLGTVAVAGVLVGYGTRLAVAAPAGTASAD